MRHIFSDKDICPLFADSFSDIILPSPPKVLLLFLPGSLYPITSSCYQVKSVLSAGFLLSIAILVMSSRGHPCLSFWSLVNGFFVDTTTTSPVYLPHCKSLNSIYLLFISPNVEHAVFICGQEECVIHKVSFNP